MNELDFIKITADEVIKSQDPRLQVLYTWSKETLKQIGSCGKDLEKQSLHAAMAACNMHVVLGLIKENGEYVAPHRIDTVLTNSDAVQLIYYYNYDSNKDTVTISHQDSVPAKPLVVTVVCINKPEATDKTESGIILKA